MSINSSKDFKKWTAIGCHNLNHLICWQFLSTGSSLLMVDLLVFRSSSSLQIFGFFQVSHLLTDSHRMLHGLMWCIQVMGISFPFHKLKSGYWDGFFVTCLPVHLRKLLTMKLWKVWRTRKRGLSRHIFQLLDMSNQFFWKICMHSFLWSGGLFYHHESWPCLQSYQVHHG